MEDVENVENVEKFESGTQLLDALKGGELSHDDVHVGMVKESEKEDHIAFAPGSCDEGWVDVPAELIGDVEVLRHVPCRDHSHPLVRLELMIDESNPVHAMVRQMFASAVSRARVGTQFQAGGRPTGMSPWSGVVPAPDGQQGQQRGYVQAPTWMSGDTGYGNSAFFPGGQVRQQFSPLLRQPPVAASATAQLPSIPARAQFASAVPGRSSIRLAAIAPGGGPGSGPGNAGVVEVECELDCCAACCRDCFPGIGCHDYPCCELSNCKITVGV